MHTDTPVTPGHTSVQPTPHAATTRTGQHGPAQSGEVTRRHVLTTGAGLFAVGAAHIATLAGCAGPAAPAASDADTPESMSIRLHNLGAADVLLLGEQHDAPEHQRLHLAAVQALVELGELAAVVLEMAQAPHTTATLPRTAAPQAVQQALVWNDSAWPWAAYGPAVMAAVAAGVPVLGGNLPRQRNTQVMTQTEWDYVVTPDILQRHRDDVREGHCNLLPTGQIAPMTRIQLARDHTLATTATSAVARGKTVLVLCGSQHAHRLLGAPLHLPSTLRVKAVRMAADGTRPDDAAAFDAIWPTAALPPVDHCATLREGMRR